MGYSVRTTNPDATQPVLINRFGQVGALKYSWAYHGGCNACSWDMSLPVNFNHYSLQPGQLVTVYDGAMPVWKGVLNDPQRGYPWRFVAQGLASLASRYLAIDNGGLPTTVMNTAVDQAIIRGLPWHRGSPGTSPWAAPTDVITQDAAGTILSLLNQRMLAAKLRWIVNERGLLLWPTDPTVAEATIIASTTPGGRSITDYFSVLYIRYRDVVSHTIKVAVGTENTQLTAKFGRREALLDVTALGEINAVSWPLSQIATNYLALVSPKGAFTGKVVIGRNQAFRLASQGTPARLSMLRAGHLLTFRGVQPDPESGELHPSTSVSVLVGDSEFDCVTENLTITPLGGKQTDLKAALAAAHAAVQTRTMLPFGVFAQ